MGLVRAWTRQLCKASGTALVVPGSIAGALAVLAVGGGFGGLSGIGQALSGPSAPVAASSAGTSLSQVARTLKVASQRTRGGAPSTHVAGIAGRGAGVSPAAPRSGAPSSAQLPGGFTPVGSGGSSGSGAGTVSGGHATGSAQPPTSVLQNAAGSLNGVANKLPVPLGGASGLGSVSSTLPKLLPGSR